MIRISVTQIQLDKYPCKECERIYELLEKSYGDLDLDGAITRLDPLLPIRLYGQKAKLMASQLVEHTCPIKLLVKAIVKSHRAKRISETRFY